MIIDLIIAGVDPSAKKTKYWIGVASGSFFPKLNVNEDPVCGSAHGNFIPFWTKCLGKDGLTARQLSKRGGTLSRGPCKDWRESCFMYDWPIFTSIHKIRPCTGKTSFKGDDCKLISSRAAHMEEMA